MPSPEILASALLVLLWLGLLRALRHIPYGLALLSLCATLLHEVSHWLVGLLLGARPVSFSLWPQRQGRRWILGSVGFRNLRWWNAAPVAFAPLALLPLGWLLASAWLLPAMHSHAYGWWLLAGYVVACCVAGCVPSALDVRAGIWSALLYGGLGVLLWRLAIFAGWC